MPKKESQKKKYLYKEHGSDALSEKDQTSTYSSLINDTVRVDRRSRPKIETEPGPRPIQRSHSHHRSSKNRSSSKGPKERNRKSPATAPIKSKSIQSFQDKTLAELPKALSRLALDFISEIKSSQNLAATTREKSKSQVTFIAAAGETTDTEDSEEETVNVSAAAPKLSISHHHFPPHPIRPMGLTQSKDYYEDKYRRNRKVLPPPVEHHDQSGSSRLDEDGSGSETAAHPPDDPTANFEKAIKSYEGEYKKRKWKEEEGSGGVRSIQSFASDCTKFQLIHLPLETEIDDLKIIFPLASTIKLLLIRDRLNRYMRKAMIEFLTPSHARKSWEKARNETIGNCRLRFEFNNINSQQRSGSDPRKMQEINNNDEIQEEYDESSIASIQELLPKEEPDKESLVREWVKIQSDVRLSSSKSNP